MVVPTHNTVPSYTESLPRVSTCIALYPFPLHPSLHCIPCRWTNGFLNGAFIYRLLYRSSSTWSGYKRYFQEYELPFTRRYLMPIAFTPLLPRLVKKVQPNVTEESLAGGLRKVGEALVERNTPFLGGSKPSLADIEVFGTLQAGRGSKSLGIWVNRWTGKCRNSCSQFTTSQYTRPHDMYTHTACTHEHGPQAIHTLTLAPSIPCCWVVKPETNRASHAMCPH